MDNATEFYHIRNALLQAALADYQAILDAPAETPALSPRYRKWETAFLRAPFAYPHRGRLGRKRALRVSLCAAILLAVSVVSVWMAGQEAPLLPGTWSFEAHEEYDSYQFHGTVPLKEMVNWTPSFLPEGYIESKRTDLGTLVEITYDCKDLDMWITFSYLRLAEGSGFDLDNEHHVVTEISVQDMDGYLYTASEDKLNAVVWFNETLGYGYLLSSRLPPDTLLKVAESVNMNTKS